MSIPVTLTTITSGYNTSVIQTNFEAISEALEDCLSRSGGSPNTMSANLDMNGNKILNASGLGSNLTEYADNTAAITGGLSVGDFYHTAGVVKVVV